MGERINKQWIYDAEVLKDSCAIYTYDIDDRDIIEGHPSSKGWIR